MTVSSEQISQADPAEDAEALAAMQAAADEMAYEEPGVGSWDALMDEAGASATETATETAALIDPTAPQRQIYGLIDVAGCRLAIQALHIREAVPYPDSLSPVPMTAPGLLGAMVLRQDTIPLVDTAVLMGVASDLPMTERVVLIVIDADHQRLLGMVVDRLHGMTALDVTQTARMGMVGLSGGMLAGAQSFVHEDVVVGLFDPHVLFEQHSLPYAYLRERTTTRGTASAAGQNAYLLCNYQDHGLAFPVEDIHATIPMHTLRDSPMSHGPCDGVIEHHGSEIPILDSLQMLGLGRNFSRPERSASVAMRVPSGGLICFEIDRFFDIVYTTEALPPVPAVISSRKELFSGVHLHSDGRHYLVVNSDQLLSEEAVVQLANTTDRKDEDEATTDAAVSGLGELYLISNSAQKHMGCRLTDIVEILRLPESLQYAEVRHDGYMGTLSHRRQLVPVFSVPNLLGEYPFFDENKACVLLFRMGEQLFGAVVEELAQVTRCRPTGTPEDKMLRKVDDGTFVPLFDLLTELPIEGGGAAAGGGLEMGELF